MAYLVKAPRVGRSQGAVIFWGLVSAFFASAFCYYYLENRNNEEKNRSLVDQVMILQGERDSLGSERNKMEVAASNTEKQLRDREAFLQEKEAKLAQEESELESAGTQTQNQSQQSAAQAVVIKKFDDSVRKLVGKVQDADVVVRGGRPVLRLPNSLFFAPAEAQLKQDGKTVLNQVTQAITGEPGRFELHVETFTDSDGETAGVTLSPSAKDPSVQPANKPATPAPPVPKAVVQPNAVDAWTLTAERAASIAHFLRDQNTLSFQNVIAVGRGDFQPIVPNSKEGHARNRRVEITITPVPPSFHPPEPKKPKGGTSPATPAPPPDPAATGAP